MNAIATKLKLTRIEWIYFLLMGLTISGTAISAYLMWGYTVPGAELACGSSSGCETVKDSPYAQVLGIPLPVLGLMAYLTLFALLTIQRQSLRINPKIVPYISLAIFAISLTGVLYSIYLTYLELFVIFAICRWCVGQAVVMTIIFPLAMLNLNHYNR